MKATHTHARWSGSSGQIFFRYWDTGFDLKIHRKILTQIVYCVYNIGAETQQN